MKKKIASLITAIAMCASTLPATPALFVHADSDSGIAVVSENAAVITKQPTDQVAPAGGKATFVVEAENAASYQWYNSVDGKKWNALTWSTADSATFTTANLTGTRMNFMYKCIITGNDGSTVETDVVRVTESSAAAVEITKHPTDQIAYVGGRATFTVEAANAVSYQWYNSMDGQKWSKLSWATADTASLTTPTLTDSRMKFYYKCVVTGEGGSTAESHVVRVTEGTQQTVTITQQPEDQYAGIGDRATFVVRADNAESYQWYNSIDGVKWNKLTWDTANAAEFTTATLNASRVKFLFKCVITGKDGSTIESDTVKLLDPAIVSARITVQPTDQAARIGERATFTIEAENAVSYLWYNSLDGVKWSKLSWDTADSAEFTTATLNATRMKFLYKCVVTGSNGRTVDSDVVKVVNPVSISSQPVSAAAEDGKTVTFSVEASGVGVEYCWQTSKNGTTWTAYKGEGADTSSISIRAAVRNDGTLYRCVVKDSFGNELISDAAALMVTMTDSGDGIEWSLENGVLTISGDGRMEDFAPGRSPYVNMSGIDRIVIEDGITDIGAYAFTGIRISEIVIPESVIRIGKNAFKDCGAFNMTVMNPICVICGNGDAIPANASIGSYSNSEAVVYAKKYNISYTCFDAEFNVANSLGDMFVGETSKLDVTGTGIRFVSTDASVAAVDSSGNVTAVGAGSAKLFALNSSGSTKVFYVNVRERAPQLVISGKTLTLGYYCMDSIEVNEEIDGELFVYAEDSDLVEAVYDANQHLIMVTGLVEGTTNVFIYDENGNSDAVRVTVRNEIVPVAFGRTYYTDTYDSLQQFFRIKAEKKGRYNVTIVGDEDVTSLLYNHPDDPVNDYLRRNIGSFSYDLEEGQVIYCRTFASECPSCDFTFRVDFDEYVENTVEAGSEYSGTADSNSNTFYTFTADKDMLYCIEAESDNEIDLEIFDEERECIDYRRYSSYPRINMNLTAGQTILIGISNSNSDESCIYTLRINERPYTEITVQLDEKYSASADYLSNTMYRFTAEEAGEYIFEGSSDNDIDFDVYNGNADRDLIEYVNYSTKPVLTVKLEAGQTVYISITNSNINETCSYTFGIIKKNITEVNVEIGKTETGYADYRTKVIYKFTSDKDSHYLFELNSDNYMLVRVYNSDMEELSYDYGDRLVSEELAISEGETIYIIPVNYYSHEECNFTFVLREKTYEEITMSADEIYSGTTSYLTNTWYSFTAPAAGEYAMFIQSRDSDKYIHAEIFAANKTDLICDFGDVYYKSFKLNLDADETICVKISNEEGRDGTNYNITISPYMHDRVTAEIGEEYIGFASFCDQTEYVFTAPEDGRYIIAASTVGLGDEDAGMLLNFIDRDTTVRAGERVYNDYYLEEGETIIARVENSNTLGYNYFFWITKDEYTEIELTAGKKTDPERFNEFADILYKFTAPETGRFEFAISEGFSVYVYDSPDRTNRIAELGNSGSETIKLNIEEGKSVYLELKTSVGRRDYYSILVNELALKIGTLELDRRASGTYTDAGLFDVFKFTAPITGKYAFESDSTEDMYGELYADITLSTPIADDDDNAGNRQFRITATLSEGQTVYLKPRHYNVNSSAEYEVFVSRAPVDPTESVFYNYSGTVSVDSPVWIEVVCDTDTQLHIYELTRKSGDVSFELYDEDRISLLPLYEQDPDTWRVYFARPQTAYLKVISNHDDQDYEFSFGRYGLTQADAYEGQPVYGSVMPYMAASYRFYAETTGTYCINYRADFISNIEFWRNGMQEHLFDNCGYWVYGHSTSIELNQGDVIFIRISNIKNDYQGNFDFNIGKGKIFSGSVYEGDEVWLEVNADTSSLLQPFELVRRDGNVNIELFETDRVTPIEIYPNGEDHWRAYFAEPQPAYIRITSNDGYQNYEVMFVEFDMNVEHTSELTSFSGDINPYSCAVYEFTAIEAGTYSFDFYCNSGVGTIEFWLNNATNYQSANSGYWISSHTTTFELSEGDVLMMRISDNQYNDRSYYSLNIERTYME